MYSHVFTKDNVLTEISIIIVLLYLLIVLSTQHSHCLGNLHPVFSLVFWPMFGNVVAQTLSSGLSGTRQEKLQSTKTSHNLLIKNDTLKNSKQTISSPRIAWIFPAVLLRLRQKYSSVSYPHCCMLRNRMKHKDKWISLMRYTKEGFQAQVEEFLMTINSIQAILPSLITQGHTYFHSKMVANMLSNHEDSRLCLSNTQ